MATVTTASSGFMGRLTLPKDPFYRTLLALALGIFCGLFFGEGAAPLKTVGIAYVRLMQMTVLPYIVVSVVAGISRLNPAGAGAFGFRALTLIIFLWLVSWLTSFMIPLAYPDWTTGSFFSSPLSSSTQPNLMDLFIPANIFTSLANSVVPAVVLFSITLGLALMAMSNKDALLEVLEVLETALGRIMSYIVKFAPLGIFAMAGTAAGTIQIEEISRLQIYLWTYVAACAVLGFLTLPMLIAIATPLSYADVLRCARTPMLTAYAVGTVLVVLPIIADECKKLLSKSTLASPEADSAVDVLAPTVYTLPTAGTPISLAFILFTAWFIGKPHSLDQYPAFAALGIPSSFGGMNLALPFLLDYLRLPADFFRLFILGTVVTTNLWTALAAMHGVVLCLLAACAVTGRLRWSKLVLTGAAGIALSAIFFWTLGFAFKGIVPEENTGEQRLLAMQLTVKPVAVTKPVETDPLPAESRKRKRITVIRERGSLRVGVLGDRLPFVFRNSNGTLVGLDMELMHTLARDLSVSLELIKVQWSDAVEWLDSGRVDLVTGGIAITPKRALKSVFTRAYVDETPGFLFRDENRGNFTDMEKIRQLPSLKLGVMPGYFHRQIQHNLPNAELVVLDSPKPFLRGDSVAVDAMIFPVQMGSVWTLIYPQFMAVVPDGLDVTVPVGFAISTTQPEFLSFLNNWLEVNIKIGMVADLHQHWVLGDTIVERPPRWSIIRDVLHWIE